MQHVGVLQHSAINMSSALILLLIHCTAGMRDIPALVSALHQYMRHTFLSVYYIQQPDLKQFLTLQKILKFARVSVAVSSLQQYYNSSNTFHVILPPYDLANNISSLFGEYCNMSMSWLIFIDVPTHQLMKNSHIPVNCEVIVVHADSTLTEVYHLQNNLQESAVGSWSDTHGLQWTAEKFLQRRSNLKGITLKAATISNPPILVPVEQNGIVTSVEGFFGDVWAILEKKMNFTSVYSVPHDGAYCAIYKNGSWSGMIGMIRNHEVEVAISDFTITNIRAEVIDFTQPLIFTRFCVLIKQPDSAVTSWTSFLAPFSTELWLTILAAIFLIAFHLTVYYQHFTSPSKFLDAVFQAFAMFCLQVSGQETPRSLSGRILYLAAYLTVMILPAAYSAALISFLTVQINELPFTTLKGLVEHSSYQLEVLANSAPLNYFDKSTDPLMMQINKEHIQPRQDELPLTVHQGLLRACTRRNYAFMTSLDIAMAMTKDIPCSVIPILGAAIPDTLALALSKRSPYRELINYNLQDIQRSGVMARLRINAWPGKTTQLKPLWTDVTIDTVMPVLGIVAAGIVIAFVFLSFEYLICKLTALFLAKNMGVIS